MTIIGPSDGNGKNGKNDPNDLMKHIIASPTDDLDDDNVNR